MKEAASEGQPLFLSPAMPEMLAVIHPFLHGSASPAQDYV